MTKCVKCDEQALPTEPLCKECKKCTVGLNAQGNPAPTVAIDMDGVLCDFMTPFLAEREATGEPYPHKHQYFFIQLPPIEGAIKGFQFLHHHFDAYILTRPSIWNVHCYSEKAAWVQKYLGFDALFKMSVVPQKQRCWGDYLIDDSTDAGQLEFKGTLLPFGPGQHDWDSIIEYFKEKYDVEGGP